MSGDQGKEGPFYTSGWRRAAIEKGSLNNKAASERDSLNARILRNIETSAYVTNITIEGLKKLGSPSIDEVVQGVRAFRDMHEAAQRYHIQRPLTPE